MGYTFDIGIWVTYDLSIDGLGDPESALNKFVPENFQEAGHSVNLTIHTTNPNPPAESLSAPDQWPTEDDPCAQFGQEPTTYNDLLEWWLDWHACNASETHGDANILVTNYDSTAGVTTGDCDETGNHYCVAEAHRIGDLADEDVDNAGPDVRYSQMYATVLHEIGHAVIDETGSFSCSSDPSEERMGNSWRNFDFDITYTTPMVTWDNSKGSKNECCTDLASEPSDPYWTRSYSQCVQDHLVNCQNKY
jgi:hypothetical protein